jgi:two-component system sensor histidine kinase VicK
VDPDKITQVLSNLVDNAIKFTPEGGTAHIFLTASKDGAVCEVRDTGVGIARENLNKAFEKFQQFSRQAGPGEKGFGLGLPIAKGIIELHKGRIWIKSRLGKGTRVMFSLPLHRRKKERSHV